MTGLEKILDQIIQNAREKADVIQDQAKVAATERIRRAEEQLKIKEEEESARIEEHCHALVERKTSAAMRKGRQIILEKKQALIETAVAGAKEKFLEMDTKEYLAFVLRCLEPYQKESSAVLRFVNGKGENSLKKISIEEVKKAVLEKFPSIQMGEDIPSEGGGFILTLGAIEIDMTFAALLREKMDEMRDLANRLLFEEAGQ